MTCRKKTHNAGQAMLEYLFILIFIIGLSIAFINRFGAFMGGTFGNMAYVLSQSLSTGICEEYCFRKEYKN